MLSMSKICPLCVQKVQNPPKFLPKPYQNLPKTLPKRPQIYPEALLEPILSQWLKEARFWTFKKRPRDGQKHPKKAQDGPKPFPNTTQDPPKIDFCWIFGRFLSSSKFAKIFFIICSLFFTIRTLKNYGFPIVKPHFLQNRHFLRYFKDNQKIKPKSSQNPPQTLKNRAQIAKNSF